MDDRHKSRETPGTATHASDQTKVGEPTPNPLPSDLQTDEQTARVTEAEDSQRTKPFPDDPTAPQRRQGLSDEELTDLEHAGGAAGGMQAGSGSSKAGGDKSSPRGPA